MKKIGILVFYLNIGNLAPEDVEDFVQSCVKNIDPVDKTDENEALNYWERIFVPIRDESRIQVIRNDEQDIDDILLSELKEKLQRFEEFNLSQDHEE